MGMTIAEKILASKSGRSSVTAGEIVDAYPDIVMSHTATWRSVAVMEKLGATKLFDPDRIALEFEADFRAATNPSDDLVRSTARAGSATGTSSARSRWASARI